MRRVYRYRLYPTREQDAVMRRYLERLRELYNAALQERRDAYRRQGVSIGAAGQMRELREVRQVRPEYGAIHTHLLQDAITRLDRAFGAFFRRIRASERPGFPRFKGQGRYRTFTFKDIAHRNGAAVLDAGRRVRLTGIGVVKVKRHRKFEGIIKQVSVTLAGDDNWYVAFICDDVPAKPLPATGQDVGVDVGIKCFAALSDGSMVENPRPYKRARSALRRAQRRVSRRKRASHRRRKAVIVLRGQHDRVRRTRLDFHHKVAKDLVDRFDAIYVEDLNIKGMCRGWLAREIHDAAWAQFFTILASKAGSAGRKLSREDPRGTSQNCSECGAKVPKALSVRIHRCPYCGYRADRDVNAARNIQRLGHSRRGGLSVGQPVEPRSPFLAL